MEQFNKVMSFILGLVVVVIFLAVATGKINLKGAPFFSKGATNTKVTPTPTPLSKQNKLVLNQVTDQTPAISYNENSSSSQGSNPDYHSYNGAPISSIPSTGPELLLPLSLSSLFAGFFLKGKAKK